MGTQAEAAGSGAVSLLTVENITVRYGQLTALRKARA